MSDFPDLPPAVTECIINIIWNEAGVEYAYNTDTRTFYPVRPACADLGRGGAT